MFSVEQLGSLGGFYHQDLVLRTIELEIPEVTPDQDQRV